MLIECKIPELDNIVKVGASVYHFRRRSMDRNTPMLCDVVDTTHAAELLSMPDFAKYSKPAKRGADDGDDEDIVGDDDGNPGDTSAVADSRYASMTLEELAVEFKDRFGRAPHPQAKPETLAARLLEADQAK